MRITISGPPGSGKSTLCRSLAEHFGFDIVSAGDVFRQLARERHMTLEEFGKLAECDPDIDMMIDQRQKKIAKERDNIIIEGRLSGYLIDADLKIWLKASLDVRSGRISKRENNDYIKAKEETRVRELCESARYLKYYGIDIKDLSVYDIVLDSSKWDQEAIARIVINAIEELSGCSCLHQL